MARRKTFVLLMSGALLVSGCSISIPGKRTETIQYTPKKGVDLEMQSICDVNRSRAREDLLKKIHIEKFRDIAMRISREVSEDEISDLERLERTRRGLGTLPPEASRGRVELIDEIYTGAILRAGYKPFTTESLPGSDLTYKIGVDALTSGNDMYASIVVGRLFKDPAPEGQFSQVSLSASPDQSRYYVELYQLARVETQSDGTQIPIYSTSSLYDAVDAMVPHYCEQVETALNLREFNTIPGLRSNYPDAETPIDTPVSPGTNRNSPVPGNAPVPGAPTVPAPVTAAPPSAQPTAVPAPASTARPAPAAPGESAPPGSPIRRWQ